MPSDPLWEDLGYHGKVDMSLSDSFASVRDAALLFAQAAAEFREHFPTVPNHLRADPAPDWK